MATLQMRDTKIQTAHTTLTVAAIIGVALATTIWITTRYGGGSYRRIPAVAATPVTGCMTINIAGTYQLTQDISITDPPGRACFIIAANDVIFDGNSKTVNVYKPTDLPAGSYYPVFAVDILDNGDTTNGWHNITVTNLTSNFGIRIIGDTINNVTLDHLNVWQIENLGGDDVTITNNTVGAGGINISGNGQPTWFPMRTVVRYNTVTGGIPEVSKLFEIAGTSDPCPRLDAVVEYNIITATHSAESYGGLPNDEATAARIRCATHTRFANNTIRSTGFARGLFLRDESDDGVYENNTVITNTDPAFWIQSGNIDKTFSSRNTFHNNIFRTEAGYVIYTLGIGSQNTFTDNVFYLNSAATGRANGFGSTTGNTFNHNTFYNAAAGGRTLLLTGDSANGPPTDTFTNNIFSYSGTAIFGYDAWLASRYDGNNNLFHNRTGALSFGSIGSNLAAWQSATGDDAQSINLDPLLTDPAAGDFTLQAGSPAINAASDGTNIGARTNITADPSCTEIWTCGSWSTCTNNSQTRTCNDVSNCGTTTNKPTTQQSCTSSCTESWICGTWSACQGGVQTRTCTDANTCGTTVNRPAIQQACTASCTESWTCSSWSTCFNSSQTRTCTDANGCGTTTTKPIEQQTCTVVVTPSPTTLKITAPRANGTVRNTVLITANTKDKSGIARVEFRIDGALVGVDSGSPYRAKWNSRSVWNGTHHLTVTAINRQNVVTTKEADFTVANSIKFTFPKPGTLGRVSGVVPLTVTNITGGNGSFNVVYRLSKITVLGQGTATNHGLSWDTRTVKNAYYRLRARVTDSTGRTAEHTTVVKVAN